MKKVLFDTDIGIDDAMALLFLHYSPEVELQAIITGFGNASIENTTRNTLFMKDKFSILAPVFRGADRPYSLSKDIEFECLYPDFVHGENGLGDINIPEAVGRVQPLPGAEAIVEQITQQPGEISVVAVGRLTNLAHALDLCPELPQLVKEVIVMGGAFGYKGHQGNVTAFAEANIWGDVLAAQRVLEADFPLTMVGLDVTEETVATSALFDRLRDEAGEAGKFIHQISRHYLQFHENTRGCFECPLHDASAVAYLLRPHLYTTEQAQVEVVQLGERIGQTVERAQTTKILKNSVKICTQVEAEKVLDLYCSVLART